MGTSGYTFVSKKQLSGKGAPSQQGVILIALLWVLVALSLIAMSFASVVRLEVQAARASDDSEKAYFFARGAIESVLYRLAYPDGDPEKQKKRFPYSKGMNHFWSQNEEMICHVAILDETARIDLNKADDKTLGSVFQFIGVDEALRTQIISAIKEWREPAKSSMAQRLSTAQHRPFHAVEELLLLPGVTQQMMYGGFRKTRDGKTLRVSGLMDIFTVFPENQQVNANYASFEVLAALPGVSVDTARTLIYTRESQPLGETKTLSQKLPEMLRGEALALLTTESSRFYSVIATAAVKNSNLRRSIKTIVKRDENLPGKLERLVWYDEYSPSEDVLRWLRRS